MGIGGGGWENKTNSNDNFGQIQNSNIVLLSQLDNENNWKLSFARFKPKISQTTHKIEDHSVDFFQFEKDWS